MSMELTALIMYVMTFKGAETRIASHELQWLVSSCLLQPSNAVDRCLIILLQIAGEFLWDLENYPLQCFRLPFRLDPKQCRVSVKGTPWVIKCMRLSINTWSRLRLTPFSSHISGCSVETHIVALMSKMPAKLYMGSTVIYLCPERSGCCHCWLPNLWLTEADDEISTVYFAEYQPSISWQIDCFRHLSS